MQRKETPHRCACICGPSVRTDEGIKIAQEKEVKEGWRSMKVHFLIKYSAFPDLDTTAGGQLNVSQVFSLNPSDLHPSVEAASTEVISIKPTWGGLADECVCEEFSEFLEFSSSSRPSPLLQCCSGISSLCFDFLLSSRSSTSGVIRHIHSGISESRGQM